MFAKTFRVAAAGLLLASNLLVLAQGQTVGSVLGDTKLPTLLKPADIPTDFKAMRLKLTTSSGFEDLYGGSMGMVLLSGMGGSGNAQGNALVNALSYLDVVWTKGDVVNLSGHDFLIAYKSDMDYASMAPGRNGPATPRFDVHLTYIRVDSIASIAPRPDLTKEAFVLALASTPEMQAGVPPAATVAATPSDPKTQTLSNAKQIATGMLMYTADYDDFMPYVQDTRSAYYVTTPYVKNPSTFKTLNPKGGILKLNMSISGVTLSEIPAPADTPMYYDTNSWPDGSRVVAFVDGHAKVLSSAEWERLQPNLNLKLKRTIKPLPPGYGSGPPKGGGH